MIYATFIVTTLVKERGFSEAIAGNFWSWVGFLSLFSGPVFGTLSDRLGRKTGLMIVFSLQTLAYLLVAANLPPFFLYLSIGFYGIVAWSIPSIMVAAVSEYVGIDKALAAFGFITFIFGLGQIAGPASRRRAGGADRQLLLQLLHGRGFCRRCHRAHRLFEKTPPDVDNVSVTCCNSYHRHP